MILLIVILFNRYYVPGFQNRKYERPSGIAGHNGRGIKSANRQKRKKKIVFNEEHLLKSERVRLTKRH